MAPVETTGLSAPRVAPVAVAPIEPGTLLDHYRVVELIGRGGMGVIYRAVDEKLDREVAIKVLQPALAGSAADLVREAQTLARLSHPNVVTVHEVGSSGDQVFVAMELVAGPTLRRWLAEKTRSWREIVAAFAAAGHGLAAAHRAGIVHRDFKPDNVLVGGDGRVRVVDFGLAGGDWAGAAAAGSPALADTIRYSAAASGTPAYMAPEQHLRQDIDARADQYAFAVSLHEALYGTRPFAGASVDELRRSVIEGRLAPRTRPRGVPARVRAAVDRALEVARERRFPSMDALLGELERERRWPARVLLGGALVAVAAATALAMRPAAGARCDDGAARLAGVWDGPRKAAVRAAFAGTARPYAAATWERVEGLLDGYAAGWKKTRLEVCRDTEVRHVRSAAAFDLGMTCLEQRASAFGQLTALLARAPDLTTLDRSTAAASSLEPADRCTDVTALGRHPPPAEPQARVRYDALLARLTHVSTLVTLGHGPEGAKLSPQLVEDARALGDASLLARALTQAAWAAGDVADVAAEESRLREALVVAARAKDDTLEVWIWLQLVHVVAFSRGHPAQAIELVPMLLAAAARAEVSPRLAGSVMSSVGLAYQQNGDDILGQAILGQALVLGELWGRPTDAPTTANTLGMLFSHRGLLPEAEAMLRHSHELFVRALGPTHPSVAAPLVNLGLLFLDEDKYAEAQDALEEGLAIYEKAYGGLHTQVAITLVGLANLRLYQGRYDEALAALARAEAIDIRLLGPEHRSLGSVAYVRGEVLRTTARLAESAAEHERALALREKTIPDSESTSLSLSAVARARVRDGRLAEAKALAQRALDIARRKRGPASTYACAALARLADVAVAEHQPKQALELVTQARAAMEKSDGQESRGVAPILLQEAGVLLALGRKDDAVAALRRAGAIQERRASPRQRAEGRFQLARALGKTAEALELARQAREEYAREGELGKAELAAVDAWLRGRRAP